MARLRECVQFEYLSTDLSGPYERVLQLLDSITKIQDEDLIWPPAYKKASLLKVAMLSTDKVHKHQ